MINTAPTSSLSQKPVLFGLSGLKLVAIYKIAKGIVVLLIGLSLVFITAREAWLDALIDWTHRELMLPHGKITQWVIEKIEEFLTGDQMRATGIVALVYSIVLFIEGIGVWFDQRWAEVFMVFASGGLIPYEVWHFVHEPSLVKAGIVAANIALVWYLYRVLMQKRAMNEAKETR